MDEKIKWYRRPKVDRIWSLMVRIGPVRALRGLPFESSCITSGSGWKLCFQTEPVPFWLEKIFSAGHNNLAHLMLCLHLIYFNCLYCFRYLKNSPTTRSEFKLIKYKYLEALWVKTSSVSVLSTKLKDGAVECRMTYLWWLWKLQQPNFVVHFTSMTQLTPLNRTPNFANHCVTLDLT